MSVLLLSTIGGLISALSTGAGSLLAPLFGRFESLRKYHMSMDFALGVMLSAVAFSLVGPEIIKGTHTALVLLGLLVGGIFIYLTHKMIDSQNSKMLLIGALLFHNFPEGMGAGASLAGMNLNEAIPLQVAISIQNVAEGLLLTLLLGGLGVKMSLAVIGGIVSGLVEFSGAIVAGLVMQQTVALLPFLLALAGGSMMMSVGLEIYENLALGKKVRPSQFLSGMMVIPLTNLLLG